MKQVCKTDKNRDLGFTIPDLAIDIVEAVTSGVIKNVPVSLAQYNMMSDTDEIGSVVRDGFTAIDMNRQIQAQMSTQEG